MASDCVLVADRTQNYTSFLFNERVTAMDYSFMEYSELVSMILYTRLPFLRKGDMGLIWFIYGQKSGVFMQSDFNNYPSPPRTTRGKTVLKKLRKEGYVSIYKRHSRSCTNIYILSPKMRVLMTEMYEYLLLLKKIPINQTVLGDLMNDRRILLLCMRQNSECDVIREKYTKYVAKKR